MLRFSMLRCRCEAARSSEIKVANNGVGCQALQLRKGCARIAQGLRKENTLSPQGCKVKVVLHLVRKYHTSYTLWAS